MSKQLEKEIDHNCTDTVICPYCGHDNGGDDGDGPLSGVQECYECERKFDSSPSYTVYYTTFKLDCLNGLSDHKWGKPWQFDDSKELWSCRVCEKREYRDRVVPAPEAPVGERRE